MITNQPYQSSSLEMVGWLFIQQPVSVTFVHLGNGDLMDYASQLIILIIIFNLINMVSLQIRFPRSIC